MARRQVISCPWQDEQGNVLALGRIVFEASGDALVTGTGELCSGIKGSLSLDNTGSVAASPAQYMWPTDQMSPSNITYTVWVYSANGQIAWGPNYGLTVPSGAGSFNLCTWVPNQIGSSSGAAAGSITLQVNGVNNFLQNLLNLESSDSSVIITDEGNGSVNFQVSGGGPAPSLAFSVLGATSSGVIQCGNGGANTLSLGYLFIPYTVTFDHIALVTTADSGGALSDFGIYALSSNGTVGTLRASIGPVTGVLTATTDFPTVQGSVTLQPGRYLIAATSNSGTTGFQYLALFADVVDYEYTTANISTGGTLPSTITTVQSALVQVPNNYDNYALPVLRLHS